MNEALRSRYLEAMDVPDFLHNLPKSDKMGVQKITTRCLVIETSNAQSFCLKGESRDFLLKMLGAIGLTQDDIHSVSINADALKQTLSAYNATTVLLMSADLKPVAQHHFVTHHPSAILTNAPLKREAWEVLKKMKAWLK